jgi:corrinoid protein of di/trimethylamine methyltransferase
LKKTVPNPHKIRSAILEGDAATAEQLARASLDSGLDRLQALEPFIAAIRQAGDLFEEGEFFLPQLLMASNAMKAALGVIFPESGGEASGLSRGTVIAGTVQGDIHEIGKNLVCALLAANSFHVVDLGGDVHLDRFVQQTQELKPDILAMSALLTTTMVNQKNLIDRLKEAGLRDRVKVMVGGAPVTKEWAKSIGADGYAPDAARAVDEALRLLGQARA